MTTSSTARESNDGQPRPAAGWNPQQYLKFGAERLRPALDLVGRIASCTPRTIVDLGCGTGALTAVLRSQWPQARIVGIDNSEAMLARARGVVPDVHWEFAELADWAPEAPVDLIVSNAALHWIDHHERLFPRLVSHLAKGGVLAVQMPAQHEAPSHRIGYDLAESGPWSATLRPLVRRAPILNATAYYTLLRPHTSNIDLWYTEYVQRLSGPNPVAEFTKGSFVGVWLSALPDDLARAFESDYRALVEAAYPPLADGTTLFAFRRFFLVARR